MQYSIIGMHCASCATKIEKALGRVSGVAKASVNFATETAKVEGTATIEELSAAVKKVGGYSLVQEGE